MNYAEFKSLRAFIADQVLQFWPPYRHEDPSPAYRTGVQVNADAGTGASPVPALPIQRASP